jgi:hypothetical protein
MSAQDVPFRCLGAGVGCLDCHGTQAPLTKGGFSHHGRQVSAGAGSRLLLQLHYQEVVPELDGTPVFLSNSVEQIEGEFLPQAMSCITCHSRAAFDDEGQAMSGLPVVHGTPDPSWFYDNVGTPLPWQLKYKQSNFIWSVALDACPKISQPGS